MPQTPSTELVHEELYGPSHFQCPKCGIQRDTMDKTELGKHWVYPVMQDNDTGRVYYRMIGLIHCKCGNPELIEIVYTAGGDDATD